MKAGDLVDVRYEGRGLIESFEDENVIVKILADGERVLAHHDQVTPAGSVPVRPGDLVACSFVDEWSTVTATAGQMVVARPRSAGRSRLRDWSAHLDNVTLITPREERARVRQGHGRYHRIPREFMPLTAIRRRRLILQSQRGVRMPVYRDDERGTIHEAIPHDPTDPKGCRCGDCLPFE